MYQSIDDDLESQNPPTQSRRASLLSYGVWTLGIIAIAAIFAAIYISQPDRAQNPAVNPSENPQALAAYRKALGETDAAFRRARLQDFLRTYPAHSRTETTRVQLGIIDLEDGRDWNALTNLIYNPRVSRSSKLEALQVYDTKWRAELLGGRSEEITRLKNEILGTPDETPPPDRRLVQGASPIPKNIKDDDFLGAPRRRPPPVIRPAPQPTQPVRTRPINNAKIVMPRVRRKVTPRYPRKAHKRKIEAVVTLKLNIGADGKVKMTELVSVEAKRYEKNFVRAAERAAMRTRFHPKTINGKAVPASGFVRRYRFTAN